MRRLAILAVPFLALTQFASAFCPLCVVAVGAGVGILRSYGVDDAISGIWYGAFVLACILWAIDWVEKHDRKFRHYKWVTAAVSLVLFIAPLYWPFNLFGSETQTLFGINKFIVGIGLGFVIFYLGLLFDRYIRRLNDGKILFYYQKVVFPVALLSVASVITWLILGITG
jgi:hypothetical protein